MTPPVAKKIPHDVSAHGEQREDAYYWLRNRDNPDVSQYLIAENEYTTTRLAHTEQFQQELYDEMFGRIKEADSSASVEIDGYFYYTRTEAGKQYQIHCRKKETLDAAEEILLDENELAEGNAYFAIGGFAVSPDQQLLAYSTDVKGDEAYSLYVKDLASGEIVDEGVTNTYYGLEWANDSKTLFYVTLDELMRPDKLYRRQIGTPLSDDALIFHEEEDAFFLGIRKTKSREFIILSSGSNTTNEEYFLSANDPEEELRTIQKRKHELEYYVAHHDDRFFILTNDKAKNFKVVTALVDAPSMGNWRELIPHRTAVKIDELDVFAEHLVLYERENGLKKIQIVEISTGHAHYISFPDPVYTYWTDENRVFDTHELRFTYTSMIAPRVVYDYDMVHQNKTVIKQYEVPGGYDPELYESERIFATANDGTRIPISLVYKKGLRRDGSSNLFLYGYGSYGVCIEPYFVTNRLSLLDRGFVFAIAHVRGGGEMGRIWYDQGKLLNKRNTFTDFIACAEHLEEKGYTSRGQIACSGGSAGGLLMGAIINMRPEMWGAVIANVPFVDVLTTMLDESIPLTVIEYEEWGNPNNKKYYEYMRSYSPYDNVTDQDYPHMLITAGLNDPRVQYWEPAKWVARLRRLKTDKNLLMLKTKMSEGHGGASGRYDYLRDIAFEYAFLFHCFGIA